MNHQSHGRSPIEGRSQTLTHKQASRPRAARHGLWNVRGSFQECTSHRHGGQHSSRSSCGTEQSDVKHTGMLARLALLLCIAGALGRRHEVEFASRDEDRPSDVIGDAALRDRLDAAHWARLSRLHRLRRQHQPVAPYRDEPLARGGPYEALEPPQGPGSGRRDYDDDDDDSSSDDGENLYADDEEADSTGGMHGGVGGGRGGEGKRGGGGVGGQINSVHRDPYTDVADDENDEYGNGRNGDNRGGRRGELSGRESQGGNGNAGPGDSRDNGGGPRRRMDCIVDRINTCIEWCRLKPTDTRLRQNRDNEPCRYWRGDSKNKWMQSGICHNGRCG
ncbi:uncharacterized protein LOC142767357 [Rhipicephalus microplus]|uniref:uncharacterized protein LOC142767357 n=1 Tax=Rhipicephalus microplus TaxID=6941 RepID=UPI003F6C3CA1